MSDEYKMAEGQGQTKEVVEAGTSYGKKLLAESKEGEKHPAETGATVQLPEGIEPSLNELFDRNPLEWEEADLERVVLHMRESRRLFQKGQDNAKKAGKTKAKTSAAGRKALAKPTSALNLGDLGL